MEFLKNLIEAIFRRVKKKKTRVEDLVEKIVAPGVTVKKTGTGSFVVTANRHLTPEELMEIIKTNFRKE